MAQYNLGVPSSSLTNIMGTPGIAGVNTSPSQSASPSSSNKPFLKTTGGKILTGIATGGLGLLATGLFKKSKLTGQMDEAMGRIQGLDVSPEMQQAYQQSQALSNQGMDAASKQLAIQEQGRGMNTAFRALGSRRSALAGIPGLAASSGDFAMRLAAQDAMMRRENKLAGIQTGMQFGQTKMDLEKSKAEAQYNALAAKKQARQQLTNSIIGSVGQIAGAVLGKK
jgi:hypothetical protein